LHRGLQPFGARRRRTETACNDQNAKGREPISRVAAPERSATKRESVAERTPVEVATFSLEASQPNEKADGGWEAISNGNQSAEPDVPRSARRAKVKKRGGRKRLKGASGRGKRRGAPKTQISAYCQE